MNTLSPLPYSLLPLGQYRAYRSGIQWALYTSRGCPHACRFCAISLLNNRKWRAMDALRVMSEIETLKKLGVREVAFCEDNFFANMHRVRQIIQLLKKQPEAIVWSASCRIDTILAMSEDMLNELRNTGLSHLHIGAESGSDRILKMLNKGITRSDILAANQKLRMHAIVPEYIFMTGFPTETSAEREETLQLMAQLKKDYPNAWFWRLNHYVPYPGTPLYELALEHGFLPPVTLDGWAEYGWHRSELSDLTDFDVGF